MHLVMKHFMNICMKEKMTKVLFSRDGGMFLVVESGFILLDALLLTKCLGRTQPKMQCHLNLC